jgi:hypothetical protein
MKMANQGSHGCVTKKHYWTSLVIYTDKELKKIKDIQNNSEFSALFYDSKNYYKFGSKGKLN